MELTVEQMLQQGVAAHNAGNSQEAERLYRAILQVQPKHPDANHNLGLIAVSMNRPGVALPLFKNAIKVNPNIEQFWLSYIEALIAERQFEKAKQALKKGKKKGVAKEKLKVLTQKLVSVKAGNIPAQAPSQAEMQKFSNDYQNGQYGDAETLATSIIERFPDHQFGWKALVAVMQQTDRISEALVAGQKAVDLDPQDAESHSNLGITLKELGRLEEAEASYRQAIAIKPVLAEVHSNLGVVLYISGDIDSGLESLEKAMNIDPNLADTKTILTILQARKAQGKTEVSANNISNPGYGAEQFPPPFFANRVVETELITSLYKMKSIELDKFNSSQLADARYGNGKCSRDFNLFKDGSSIIKSVAEDLIIIMREAVETDIYLAESFFNILGAGGGTTPHGHINKLDADENLNFAKQKYSLVYYLSVGDQNCSEPGILKFYDPDEEFLPSEGMIAISPADRKHSAVYGGEKDRVMIGVNFYSL